MFYNGGLDVVDASCDLGEPRHLWLKVVSDSAEAAAFVIHARWRGQTTLKIPTASNRNTARL
jgi:hypothetical protein